MPRHHERHKPDRIGWLRAAVLGANDGILSTASLVVGVASAEIARGDVLTAGVAGMVAGAMSMGAGEYVSVSSQADAEAAELAREQWELERFEEHELEELENIYVARGLDRELARQVALQLHEHDALAAHARDELGLSEQLAARPLQAAVTSAVSFAAGASVPLCLTLVSAIDRLAPTVALGSLVALAVLGAFAARAGGASLWKGALRVSIWGALAMTASAIVGSLFGTVV
jgi:VIT1/CCC1 family predicted Fe2+/Mn2+ transporter